MHYTVDPRQPVQKSVASVEPSHQWESGRAVDDEGALLGRLRNQNSFWVDCECPDDCPRDHPNE